MIENLIDSFLLIDQIKKRKRLTYENGEVVWLNKNKHDNYYTLKDSSLRQRNNDEDIVLTNRKEQILIPYLMGSSNHTNISENFTRENSYKVDTFQSKSFSQNKLSYFRLLIPIKKRLDFFTTIQYDTINSISFIISGKEFHFYQESHNNQKYLIIDSANKLKHDKFSDNCFAILLSYAFITGDFFQGEKYYFAYDNNQMKMPVDYLFDSFRESLFSVLRPICTNPHAYRIENIEMSELEKVSKEQFASICEKCLVDVDFRILLLQIIEASQATLLTSAFMLAVCLEELVEIFLSDNEKRKTLDEKEKIIFCDAIEKLKKIQCNSEKEKVFLNSILTKVHDLGKNESNMKKIYNLYKNIDLTAREKEALKNRNKLLHGTLPEIKGVKLDSEKLIDKAYWYLQLRLYTLVTLAVLKNVGFTNKILNHYSLNEKAIGFFQLSESNYRNMD